MWGVKELDVGIVAKKLKETRPKTLNVKTEP